jgi:hypothetical protein
MNALKPLAQTMEAGIPLAQQAGELTKTVITSGMDALKRKYESIVESIKGSKAEQVSQQQTLTSQELGRRGLTPGSGLWGSSINRAVSPVERYWGQQESETGNTYLTESTGLQNELAGVPLNVSQQEQAIRQKIAELYASGNTDAANTALEIWKQNQANSQIEAQQKIEAAQSALKAPATAGDYYWDAASGSWKSISGSGTGGGGGYGTGSNTYTATSERPVEDLTAAGQGLVAPTPNLGLGPTTDQIVASKYALQPTWFQKLMTGK